LCKEYLTAIKFKSQFLLLFTVHVSPVFPRIGVHQSKQTCYRAAGPQTDYFLYSKELCSKSCIVKQDFRDIDHLKCVPLQCWVI